MKLLDSLRFRIAALFQRSQMNAEMDDELRSHIFSTVLMISSAPAFVAPKPSVARASSSADINASKRSATKRLAVTSLRF